MRLIFGGQGYPRKFFNLEHFLIYGILFSFILQSTVSGITDAWGSGFTVGNHHCFNKFYNTYKPCRRITCVCINFISVTVIINVLNIIHILFSFILRIKELTGCG